MTLVFIQCMVNTLFAKAGMFWFILCLGNFDSLKCMTLVKRMNSPQKNGSVILNAICHATCFQMVLLDKLLKEQSVYSKLHNCCSNLSRNGFWSYSTIHCETSCMKNCIFVQLLEVDILVILHTHNPHTSLTTPHHTHIHTHILAIRVRRFFGKLKKKWYFLKTGSTNVAFGEKPEN